MRFAFALALFASALTVVGAAGAATNGPLLVQTSLSPRSIFVADPITATIDVFFDGDVDPSTIRVTTPFGRWQQVEPSTRSESRSSNEGRLTMVFTLACYAESCIPEPKAVGTLMLPNPTVVATTRTGSQVTVHTHWPQINIAGRFVPPKSHAIISLKAPALVPPAVYRFGPGALATVLEAVGALIVALAVGLAALEALRLRASRRGPVAQRSALARSVVLVRQAKQREVEDRRRAVGLLARVLPLESRRPPAGSPLASDASAVAWSAADPSPDDLEAIVAKVEAEFRGGT